VPPAKNAGESVVPVCENVRLYGDPFADRTLGRIPAAVDLGRDGLDHDSTPAVPDAVRCDRGQDGGPVEASFHGWASHNSIVP
jgi:hypothetical protein